MEYQVLYLPQDPRGGTIYENLYFGFYLISGSDW